MKYIALLLILLVTLLVQNSIASKASPVPPPLSQNSIASTRDKPPPRSVKPLPKFSFECILGCTGACFNTGFQCFKKCFKECKNGRLSDETNFLPKFNEIRNYQKKENLKGDNHKEDICKLPHTLKGPICKAAISRWSFDSR